MFACFGKEMAVYDLFSHSRLTEVKTATLTVKLMQLSPSVRQFWGIDKSTPQKAEVRSSKWRKLVVRVCSLFL